jgi:hypothetical protein
LKVADAILLFSVCASYGVAAGVFAASLYLKAAASTSSAQAAATSAPS